MRTRAVSGEALCRFGGAITKEDVELWRLGHDVVTMRESGHAGWAVPDTEVLELATTNERAIVTLVAILGALLAR